MTAGHLTAEYKAADADYKAWYNKGWYYSYEGANGLEHGDDNGFPDAWYDGYMDNATGRDKWHAITCHGCDEHPDGQQPGPEDPAPEPDPEPGPTGIVRDTSSVKIPKKVRAALDALPVPVSVEFDACAGANSGLVGDVWIDSAHHFNANGIHSIKVVYATDRPAAWEYLLDQISYGVEPSDTPTTCDGCIEAAEAAGVAANESAPTLCHECMRWRAAGHVINGTCTSCSLGETIPTLPNPMGA